jgi:hypothetical protein
VVRLPEASAAKMGIFSSSVTIDVELTPDAAGVLNVVRPSSGGMTVRIEKSELTYEFNALHIERTRIESINAVYVG